MKKGIISLAFAIFLMIGLIACSVTQKEKSNYEARKTIEENKMIITTTTFSSYDFVKHVVGDKAVVHYLLGPGVDAHSYEPSPSDLIKIQNADLFIYIGGEMEKWTEKVLKSDVLNVDNTVVIRASDAVQTLEETEVDGAEEHEEEEEEKSFDEHIWTSPTNAIQILNYLTEEIAKLDEENREYYFENAASYQKEIETLRESIQEIVNQKKRNRLVFGDKMPMQYFLNEFGLTASAAFHGCSTETEPSAKTITYLVNKVKEEKIPVVLYIELSSGKTAKAIAEEAGVTTAQIQTLHNVSKTDFENGETYVSLMKRNLAVLKKALQ